MRVKLAQLEALYWIGQLGGLRAAAARLNLTQPTISARVRELEQTLGAELLERSGYRARLTARGREVARGAERVLGLVQRIEEPPPADAHLWGAVRLGVADTFALTCLSSLLVELERRFPHVEVNLTVDYSRNLNRMLRGDELDVAFLTDPDPGAGFATETLVPQTLAWVANPRFEMREGILGPEDLKNSPIITNPHPSHLFQSTVDWFAAAGIEPSSINTCNSLTILVRLVAEGFGTSILPTGILASELASARLRVIPTEPEIRPHWLGSAYRCHPSGPDLGIIRDLALPIIEASGLRDSGPGPVAGRPHGRSDDRRPRRRSRPGVLPSSNRP